MTNMANEPNKMIPPIHPYNNKIVDSGTTGNFIQDTSACMNRKPTK